MAYATTADLIRRFGQQELVRLTTPAGEDMDGVVVATAEAALEDASAVMDSYLRKQVRTPLDLAPREVGLYCGDIARHILSTGDGKTPGEEVQKRYDEAMRWLRDVANGVVKLDADEVVAGDESFAQVRERDTSAAPFGRAGYL